MPAISPGHEMSHFESAFQHVVNPQVSHISQLIALFHPSTSCTVGTTLTSLREKEVRSQEKIFAFTANRVTHIEARMAVDG